MINLLLFRFHFKLSDQSKHTATFLPDTGDTGNSTSLKQDLAKILTALKTLDPYKLSANNSSSAAASNSSSYIMSYIKNLSLIHI